MPLIWRLTLSSATSTDNRAVWMDGIASETGQACQESEPERLGKRPPGEENQACFMNRSNRASDKGRLK